MEENHKLDILILTDNSLETVGGEQESTKIIIRSLKNEFKIGIVQPGKISNPEKKVNYFFLTKETRLKHLIKKPHLFLKYIFQISRLINEKKPKIIHTQSQVSFFIVSLLMKMNIIENNTFFIHTERGLYMKYNRLIKKIFMIFIKELNVLVTTTYFNKEHWKKEIKSKGIKINYEIIENTAGELFETIDETKSKKNSNFVIGFSGRYAEWKNWPLAVEIIEKANSLLGEKLLVKMAVGCLDEKAEIETNRMFKYLYNLLGERFSGDINISLKQMNEFYYDLDVFILTSNRNTESFGRTLVEAMSRNTEVLTTDAGGSVEVVNNPNKVFITSEQFVEEILKLYNNPSILRERKKRNYEIVREKYSLHNNIEKHRGLYNSMLSKKEL